MMSDKPGRQRRCLSSSKRRGTSKGSRSSSGSTPSISSFFSNAAPSRLACPLCGQMVPRYRINQHIDLNCPQFDRESSGHVTSSSSSVAVETPGAKLSPKMNPNISSTPEHHPNTTSTPEHHRNTTRTPEHHHNKTRTPEHQQTPVSPLRDRSKDMETSTTTSTSPYFKQPHPQQTPPARELSRTVVRTLELGSLSSKLSRSRRRRCPPENPHGDEDDDVVLVGEVKDQGSEALGSSQKENQLVHSLDYEDEPTASRTMKNPEERLQKKTSTPMKNPAQQQHSQQRAEELHEEATIIHQPPVLSPNLTSASSRLTKRTKTEVSKSKTTAVFSKRARDETKRELPKIQDERERESRKRVEDDDITPDDKESPKRNEVQIESSEPTTAPHRTPYYLRNFLTVVDGVLDNEDDRSLFNHQDLEVIWSFKHLPATAQQLYVRLFQRKLRWLQVDKLNYEEIPDLRTAILELVETGLLQTEQDLQDVREVLDLLPAPQLKALAKTFHLGGGAPGPRGPLTEALLRLSSQKSLFSTGENGVRDVILRRAKHLAGSCVRLNGAPRGVFTRLLLLFSLTDSLEDDELRTGQIYTMLLVNSGRMVFPQYRVHRRAKLFSDREELIRYEAAVQAQQEVRSSMQAGQWEESLELYCAAKSSWQRIRDSQDVSHQRELPVFLRCFTTGWVYTRILSSGVDILQRLKRYEEAVTELQSLLTQNIYCVDSRGRWWDRLALNLQQHLKRPEQAVEAIREGLSDPAVRTGHRLSLHQRADRMRASPSYKKLRPQLRDLPTVTVQDVPHVTICGQLFPHEGGMGKNVFLMQPAGGADDATVMCSVEQLTLAHYRKLGYDQGIHGEGGTFSTLLGLLLWDVIFMEGVPDVFLNPYQTCPLDLFTDCFYDNRKEAFDTRVQMLEQADPDTLCSMLEEVWTTHEGSMCSLISWELFSDLQQAKSVVCALGGVFLAGMMKTMMKDYRHCRGGLPDLIVWNSVSYEYKLVEVKGPSDRLSQKQQIWLDELSRMGAPVEVCHVTAQGARGVM